MTEEFVFLFIAISSLEQFLPFIISSGSNSKKCFDLINFFAHKTACPNPLGLSW